MSKQGVEFEGEVNTVAHKGVAIFLTVQDSSDLNKAGLRSTVLMFKPPERMFLATERPRMQILVSKAITEFEKMPPEEWLKYIWLWMDEARNGMVLVKRPGWLDRQHVKWRGALGGGGYQPGQGDPNDPNAVAEGQFSAGPAVAGYLAAPTQRADSGPRHMSTGRIDPFADPDERGGGLV